jgi:pimeloyl-ACP methyl ester carboxylesterase
MSSQGSEDTGDIPEIRYARSGDVHIAYQVTGSGSLDLVFVPGFVSHLQLEWENPIFAHIFHRLAAFARVIRFDKRGTGMSDRVPIATLEERMDDLRAVMDATGTTRAAIFGASEGGPMSLLFAATYPDRVASLILYGSFAKRLWAPDYPIGVPTLDRQAYLDLIEQQWGEEADLSVVAPSLAHHQGARRRFAATRRMSASPGAALAIARMNSEIDLRHVLPVIRVPTLVLHRVGDRDVKVENGRYLAANIPGARYIELPGDDHLLTTIGDADRLLDEVEEFLTGVRHGPEPDRVLATLLFTDIVASTERASTLNGGGS